ncbi:MAG: hypothetical protein P1U32_08310 [Legionellaceae bacterium]|nr:hypothetical protein [Legionellaceae bacterium]
MLTTQDFLAYPLVKGSVLGASLMVCATPGISYVNSLSANTPMPWSRPFRGCVPLANAGAVAYATSFGTKSLLGCNEETDSKWKKIWTSAVAGIMSGLTICGLEGVAQAQQVKGGSTLQAVYTVYQHFGPSGFLRGAVSMMAREGAWTTTYAALFPILSKTLQDAGWQKQEADAAAVVSSSTGFGFFSAPINRLRVMKQKPLASPEIPQKTYLELLRAMLKECETLPPAQRVGCFFRGGVPRSVTSGIVGGLFVVFNELYDEGLKATNTLSV